MVYPPERASFGHDTKIVVHQTLMIGPFPISYMKIADRETQDALISIMSAVPPEEMRPFDHLSAREICSADKAFVLKIMKLDPRDRPTSKEVLQDPWFTEISERTVGWYSKAEWQQMEQQHKQDIS